jgi:hypothetical protein
MSEAVWSFRELFKIFNLLLGERLGKLRTLFEATSQHELITCIL